MSGPVPVGHRRACAGGRQQADQRERLSLDATRMQVKSPIPSPGAVEGQPFLGNMWSPGPEGWSREARRRLPAERGSEARQTHNTGVSTHTV